MKLMGSVRRAGVLALFAAAACDDGGTGPARPASMVAMTATTQTVLVASPVPVPPSVLVTDRRGRALPGVEVAIAVTGGNGTVAATALTNQGGIAVVSDWVMGTAAVENVLTVSVPGVEPVVFRATAGAGAPTTFEKAAGDGQTAAVGTSLADSIAVRVLDQYGNGVPGVAVNFGASAGTLSATRVVTGAQGLARVGLTAPTHPGGVQVSALTEAVGLLTFAATVVAGPPAAITRTAGNAQVVSLGMPVFVAPGVRVTDSFGNPVAGRSVTFAPAPGSGMVTAGSAVTSGDGRARVGSWTPGQMGLNRLIVRVAGLDSLEFTATATVPCGTRTYTLFATVNDTLFPQRCNVAGRNAEIYLFTVPSEQCVELRMGSPHFDTFLYLLDSAGNVLQDDDDSGGGLDSLLRRRLSAGSYRLAAASFDGETGSFQLASRSIPDGQPCGFSGASASPAEKGTK